nr:MAG TPA: hypothetical protein [Bacteriophage sp.]
MKCSERSSKVKKLKSKGVQSKGDAWNRYESQWYSSTLLRIAKEKRRNAQKSTEKPRRGCATQGFERQRNSVELNCSGGAWP